MLLYTSFMGAAGGGTPVLPTFVGALAKRITSTQAVSDNTTTSVQYNGEEYDTAAFHDNSTDPSRFTVPVAYNGRYGRLSGNLFAGTGGFQLVGSQLKNNAAFFGQGSSDAETPGNNTVNFTSAIVALATSDYFENRIFYATGSGAPGVTADARNWGQFEVMPATHAGCLLKHSATQAVASGTSPVTLAWNGEEYDTDTFHDTSSNNSRITIPSTFNGRYVRLSASITFPGSSADVSLEIVKGGVGPLHGLPIKSGGTAGSDLHTIVSAPILVATGDYFEARVTYGSAVSADVPAASNNVWFQVEVLDTAFRGALVKRTSNQNIASTTATITWQSEVYDVGGWWDAGTPTKFIVPSGVSKVRLTGNCRPGSTTTQVVLSMLKGGSSFVGMGAHEQTNAGLAIDACNAWSAVVAVSQGDEFEMTVFVGSTEDIGSSTYNWFAIEAVE